MFSSSQTFSRWVAAGLIVIVPTVFSHAEIPKPALLVHIVVDQLRGDIIETMRPRFGDGGFNRFYDHGASFSNAHYRHGATFTAAGHATQSTGGNPREHGIPANRWFDHKSGSIMYCTEDPDSVYIESKTPSHAGTSPRNLLAPTLGDAWIAASAGKARAYSVAIKDRAAILLGGKKGKAFWYEADTGRFISSTYYFQKYPAWVHKWNREKPAENYRDLTWDLLKDPSTYLHIDEDDRSIEKGYKHLDRTFPHPLGTDSDASYFNVLRCTPYGDKYTLEFARRVVTDEKLGTRGVTDVLLLGLSASDYIGHRFGPYSLEAEDNLLRLDANLASFFAFLDMQVGSENVLMVLSSDHGVDGVPEGTRPEDFPRGRVNTGRLRSEGNELLQKRFGGDEPYILNYSVPYYSLDVALIERRDLDVSEVEKVLAEFLGKQEGIAHAVTRSDLLSMQARGLRHTPLMDRLLRSQHPERSGHVVVVFEPYWHHASTGGAYTATHGSPYSFDTHVPVLFVGPGVVHGHYTRLIGPEDIAPTLAALLGIVAPSGATGKVLPEVIAEFE